MCAVCVVSGPWAVGRGRAGGGYGRRVADQGVDAVVVGSGPNGLAAAVTLARAGLEVLVLEANDTVGGGARTLDLGLADGILHDVCSAVHPLAWASPFFRELGLAERVELVVPEVSYAQPLDGGRAGLAFRDLSRTVESLGVDGPAWRGLFAPLVDRWPDLVALTLSDKRHLPAGLLPGGVPTAVRLALAVLEQGTRRWQGSFRSEVGSALLTGVAAHASTPLPSLAGAGTALLLGTLAHADGGWPLPRGGSQSIIDALRDELAAHGGRVVTGHRVRTPGDLPRATAYLFDTTPRTFLDVFGARVPSGAARALAGFRYGNGAAKVDFVLGGPVPWANADVGRAGTVHVGGTRVQMATAEASVAAGRHAERPMVLASDPAVHDPGRIAGGLRPLWTYAHVPAGSDVDVTDAVVAQVERFAPGFRDVVVASRCVPAAQLSSHNANYIGGDIGAGAITPWQMVARPTPWMNPYATGVDGVYLCSASTPPGPGVHGLSGWYAARHVLRKKFGSSG